MDLTGSDFVRSRPERNRRSFAPRNHDLGEQSWETRSDAAVAQCWGDQTATNDTQKAFRA